MDSVRQLRDTLYSDEARARRQARRDLRQRKVYAQVVEALEEIDGAFAQRQAYLWNIGKRDGTRKIEGHPGSAAAMFVSETFGEFNIHGTLKTRFAGMQREAGSGGHGITEGTVTITVELKPIHGMTQMVDVPVYVKNGYLQAPGLMYHQGQPMVIAQSAIDELMTAASYSDEVGVDRKNLYCPPKTTNFRSASVVGATVDSAPAPMPVEAGPALSQRDMTPMVRREDQAPMLGQMQRQMLDDKLAKQRRQQNSGALPTGKPIPIVQGRPIAAGQTARLACEICVPTNKEQTEGYVLPEGSRVFIAEVTNDDLVRVKHENGIEVFLHTSTLS